MILRRLTILERLRPDDVSHAVPSKQNRPGNLLLGIPRNIGAHHRQTHAETQALEIAQPERDQAPPLVAVREADQQR